MPLRAEGGLGSEGEVVEGDESATFFPFPTLTLEGARDFRAGVDFSGNSEGDFPDRPTAAFGGEMKKSNSSSVPCDMAFFGTFFFFAAADSFLVEPLELVMLTITLLSIETGVAFDL